MPFCLAYGCSNASGRNVKNKGFFKIPDPKRYHEQCARWLHNMGNSKYNVKNFEAKVHHVVCSDHFHPDCFKRDLKRELCPDYKDTRAKRELVDGAIPTIFKHRTYDLINMDGTKIMSRPPSKRTLKMERANVVKKLLLQDEPPKPGGDTQPIDDTDETSGANVNKNDSSDILDENTGINIDIRVSTTIKNSIPIKNEPSTERKTVKKEVVTTENATQTDVLKRKEKGEKLNQKAYQLAERLVGSKNISLADYRLSANALLKPVY